jgi:hypothetical protein
MSYELPHWSRIRLQPFARTAVCAISCLFVGIGSEIQASGATWPWSFSNNGQLSTVPLARSGQCYHFSGQRVQAQLEYTKVGHTDIFHGATEAVFPSRCHDTLSNLSGRVLANQGNSRVICKPNPLLTRHRVKLVVAQS